VAAAGTVAAGGARKSCLPPEGEQIGDTNSVQRGNGEPRTKEQCGGVENNSWLASEIVSSKSFNHVKRHVSSARNFPDRCDLITANMMWYILVT
jgi:hypothetical protein